MSKICSSLRRRPGLEATVSILLSSKESRWGGTHDVALALPPSSSGTQSFFRFILVGPEDAATSGLMGRVERLYHLFAGANAAILFLVGDAGSLDSMSSFVKFQVDSKFDLSVVPLTSLASLPATLSAFRAAFLMAAAAPACGSPSQQQQQQSGYRDGRGASSPTTIVAAANRQSASPEAVVSPLRDLLPHCGVRSTLSQHSTLVLSDESSSLADLARRVVATEEGRRRVYALLEQGDANMAIEFWKREFPAS